MNKIETTVKDRLLEFIKHKELSKTRFEKSIGASNGYVNNVNNGLSPDKKEKIAKKYPELNMGWLLSGEGDMFKTQSIEWALIGDGNTNKVNNIKSKASVFGANLGNNNNVQKNIGVQPSVVEETLRSLTRVIEKQSSQIDDILSIIKTLKIK